MREVLQSPSEFPQIYAERLALVEGGVKDFAASLRDEASVHGPAIEAVTEGYVSLLERGGKRMRGVLVGVGYEMFGGEPDDPVAIQAGVIVEAIHASLLAMDDVSDKSETRRGGPATHVHARNYLDAQQAAVATHELGGHAANLIAYWAQWQAVKRFAQLDVPQERKDGALAVLAEGLALTGVGQILDVFSATKPGNMEDAERIATYKTAYYTLLLPPTVGARLAGASAAEAEVFQDYALDAGLAFQLQDDLIGLYGDEAETGKPRMSDLIEGKPTMLFQEALQRADGADQKKLRAAHGNPDLTAGQFDECLDIIRRTGAYRHIAGKAMVHALRADDKLQAAAKRVFGDKMREDRPRKQLVFLGELALACVRRTS